LSFSINQLDPVMALYNEGRIDEALDVLDDLIKKYSDVPGLYNISGVCHAALGQFDAAVVSYEKALKLKPDYAEAYANLGDVYKNSGHFDMAIINYERALNIKPDFLVVLGNLGNVYSDSGQLAKAVKYYERALKINPDIAIIYNNLGIALKGLGRLGEAISSYERALKIKPDFAIVYCNLGNVRRDIGQLEAAVECYKEALKIKPDYVEACINIGNIYRNLGNLDAAIEYYEQAIKINPNHAEAHGNLGSVYSDAAQFDAAIACYERALKIKPDHAEMYLNLGNVHRDVGHLEMAIECYEEALKIHPDYAEAYSRLGCVLRDFGRLEAALENFERALEIKPGYAEVYRYIGNLERYHKNDARMDQMESLLSTPGLSSSDRMHLCFALARVYEDLGRHDELFKYLNEGNSLRKAELNYNIHEDVESFSNMKKMFNTQPVPVELSKLDEAPTIQPVFIVGMPRSGTSLVEHILASHEDVHGAGELQFMANISNSILRDRLSKEGPLEVACLSAKESNRLRHEYLESLRSLGFSESIVTDKMPLNFFWIGFIRQAFPNAKIVHLCRDPMATCWSIYKSFFTSKGNGFSYDLGDLAEFYGLYMDLMEFWRQCFPGAIYDLCYERLTESQEDETRKLLDYCGLDWDDRCLYFHETSRAVRTASAVQVRSKMTSGRSEAWRKYEKHLQPLLGPLRAMGID